MLIRLDYSLCVFFASGSRSHLQQILDTLVRSGQQLVVQESLRNFPGGGVYVNTILLL